MNLSVIIITKNEEKAVVDCLKSVRQLADEIVVIDDCSEDKTVEIAKKMGAKVFIHKIKDFAHQREFGVKKAKGEWVLYLDADERVTEGLKKEIEEKISYENNQFVAYDIPRENIRFGKILRHGGWWPDYVTRLFKRKNLKGWYGKIHESPIFKGKKDRLKNPLIHFGRPLNKILEKTIAWSETEAQLLFEAAHPKVSWWRILRIGGGEFFKRFIRLRGFLDGTEGLIEAFYQSFSRAITYTRLWEIQQNF